MLPPAGRAATDVTTVNGRTYSCALGSAVNVPDQDGKMLQANGWINAVSEGGQAGTTAARPVAQPDGQPIKARTRYHDTTLAYNIVYDGATWRNPDSGAAV
jgi:hypothetical protein